MTTEQPDHSSVESSDRSMRVTFLGVIVVEVVVLAALWLFGRAFSL